MANARLRTINPDERRVFSSEDIEVNVANDPTDALDDNNVLTTFNPDGTVVVDYNPPKADAPNTGFYSNLADGTISDEELDRIASELLEDIGNDVLSRSEWVQMRERGIDLLGFKLDDPRGDLGPSSAPLEGMSSIRHPLLSEAVLRFQANARGELLPASGPVKVRSDMPAPPNGVPGVQETEDLSDALETDFNHYLTVTAPEYYPDTDRMLFMIGFGGLGIKKVYNCPLRQRPVSETVDAADFIVSNAATDLRSSGRVTHRIKMRPSMLKRMQLVGAYRDVDIEQTVPNPSSMDKKIGEIQGIKPSQSTVTKPREQEQELYETYCELDIEGLEHKSKGKVTGLRLPYKVTIHVASRKILEVRRNWLKDDKLFMPREYFVDFPFVPAFGFYPLGLVHILGNTVSTLTASWREMIDNGMFANFPGFIYAKQAGRQLSNQFRVPPGGGIGLDTGGGNIRDSIMPLPYKDVSAAFAGFIQHVEEYGQKLGSTSEMNIGEGKQEAPVGTTLALIEQATKLMDAVHKRLHSSQSREFQLLKERFKEDPEAFWRFNKKPALPWEKNQFIAALDNYNVVPVADPNNPTSLHRMAKATAIKQLQQASPALYDPMAVDKRIMRIAGVDPEGLFLDQPAPPPPDPRMEAIQAKAQQAQSQAAIAQAQAQIKAATAAQQSQDKAADRESRERIEAMKIELEKTRVMEESIIHAHDAEKAQIQLQHNMAMQAQEGQMKMHIAQAEHDQKMQQMSDRSQADLVNKAVQAQGKAAIEAHSLAAKSGLSQISDADKIAQQSELHAQKLQHANEMHKANLEAARKMAAIKPKKK